jgi:rod shape-determining protein MreC
VATYRRIRSTRLLVFGLLVASLVTITLDARGGREGPMAAIGRAAAAVVTPLQEGIAAVFRPVGSFFGNLFQAGSLAEKNAALEEEISLLRRERQEVLTLRSENAELRELVGIEDEVGYDTFGATVIGEAPSNFEWAVTIDRGADDGVTLDMPVISGLGLVGRVTEVYPTAAKVMLIIDPDSSVAVRLASSRERGLLHGQREEPLTFELIDAETDVAPGEIVETSGYQLESGLESVFPPGIPIGVVEQVDPDEGGLSPAVLVRPNVDFSTLSHVLLVTRVPDVTSVDEQTPIEDPSPPPLTDNQDETVPPEEEVTPTPTTTFR